MSVVFGGVGVEILEADEAGEVSGALPGRQVEKTQPIRRVVKTTSKTFPELSSFPASSFQSVHQLTWSSDLIHRCAFLLINSHESGSHLSETLSHARQPLLSSAATYYPPPLPQAA